MWVPPVAWSSEGGTLRREGLLSGDRGLGTALGLLCYCSAPPASQSPGVPSNLQRGVAGAWSGVANWPFAVWIWLSEVFGLARTVFEKKPEPTFHLEIWILIFDYKLRRPGHTVPHCGLATWNGELYLTSFLHPVCRRPPPLPIVLGFVSPFAFVSTSCLHLP